MTLTFIINGRGHQRQWQLPLWLLAALIVTVVLLSWSLMPVAQATVPAATSSAQLAAARYQNIQQQLAETRAQLASLTVRAELLSRQLGLGPLPEVPVSGQLPQLDKIYQLLEKWQGRHHVTELTSPLAHSRLSSGFGYRTDPINGQRRFHSGLDMAAGIGTPVHASGPGVVTFAGAYAGYGKLVEIAHGNGLVSRYGHNSQLLVTRGEQVKQGQVIARVGETGRATGPHLHFEVQAFNRPRNPADYLYRHGGL